MIRLVWSVGCGQLDQISLTWLIMCRSVERHVCTWENRAVEMPVTISSSLKSFCCSRIFFLLCPTEEQPKESKVMVGAAKRAVQRTLRNAKKLGMVCQYVMLEKCAARSFVEESGCVCMCAPRQTEQRRVARISS